MQKFNEFSLVMIGLTTVIYTEFSPTEDVKHSYGYVMISLAGISIVINLAFGFMEIFSAQKDNFIKKYNEFEWPCRSKKVKKHVVDNVGEE